MIEGGCLHAECIRLFVDHVIQLHDLPKVHSRPRSLDYRHFLASEFQLHGMDFWFGTVCHPQTDDPGARIVKVLASSLGSTGSVVRGLGAARLRLAD